MTCLHYNSYICCFSFFSFLSISVILLCSGYRVTPGEEWMSFRILVKSTQSRLFRGSNLRLFTNFILTYWTTEAFGPVKSGHLLKMPTEIISENDIHLWKRVRSQLRLVAASFTQQRLVERTCQGRVLQRVGGGGPVTTSWAIKSLSDRNLNLP